MRRTPWYKSPDFKFQQVALTLNDLQTATRHKLVQKVFNACGMECVPGAMREALKACRQEGVDLNSIVFQTGPDEWWQLLPYVMGRGTAKSIKALQMLLDEPDLHLDQRCAWRDGSRASREQVLVTMPLAHLLVRSADLKDDVRRNPEGAAAYAGLLDQMVARGADLGALDSLGNTVLHVVMDAVDIGWVDWWSERFLARGVSPHVRNAAGQTMLDVAQQRLDRAPVNTPADERARFVQSLMRLEQRVLTDVANDATVVATTAPARPRPRL